MIRFFKGPNCLHVFWIKFSADNILKYFCYSQETEWKNKKNIISVSSAEFSHTVVKFKNLNPSDWRPGGRGFNPRRGRQHSFVEIDHEIFSTVILSLPLIQEVQLSVSGERMCTILVNCLED